MADRRVMVIGGGVAGMAAAGGLDRHGIGVDLVEKAPFLGGHAAGYTCKATEACAQCGACMVEDLLADLQACEGLQVFCGARLEAASREGDRWRVSFAQAPVRVDPRRCSACGLCLDTCPRPGEALEVAFSPRHRPLVALVPDRCLHFSGDGCTRCRDVCPEGAIDLGADARTHAPKVDAVVVAAGFAPFDPAGHALGAPPRPVSLVDPSPPGGAFTAWQYPVGGRHANVLTHLELEDRLRRGGPLTRPSDGAAADRVAFVQCVGSRDAALGHLWCSRVCCGAALRMASLVRHRRPATEITVFYIDIQTVGRDFGPFYRRAREGFHLVRAIPADLRATRDDRLRVTYFDSPGGRSVDAEFDLLVLSVGMTPPADAARLAALWGGAPDADGFLPERLPPPAVFCAGSVRGPMGIADAVADGRRAVWNVLQFLREAP